MHSMLRALAGVAALATCGVSLPFEAAPPATPFKIIILFDCSTSMGWLFQDPQALMLFQRYFPAERISPGEEAVRAVGAELGPAGAARIGFFGRDIRFTPDWASTTESLVTAGGQVLRVGGPSPVWDAVYAAVEELEGVQDRRVIVLVSDGRSSGNAHGFEETRDRALRSSVTIHAAHPALARRRERTLEADRQGDPAARLKELAETTEGRYSEPQRSLELAEFVRGVVSELRGVRVKLSP